jgi:hypothetical protein
MKIYDKLCNPAKFYFILSTVMFIFVILQNIGTPNRFALGSYSCRHSSPGLILVCHALYIVFWTWLLNLICKLNTNISWVIVLFPFLLLFIALGLVLFEGIHKDKKDGFGNGAASQMTL